MSGPMPLYEAVKRRITDGIASGLYGPGSKLPSEKQLVDSLSVSRMTVNRALRELVQEGAIVRLQGVGSFVSEPRPISSLSEVRDIREIIEERGGTYTCKVLQAKTIPADTKIAERFSLERGAPLVHIVAVHFESGHPLQLERRYIRPDFAPDVLALDLSAQSLSAYLHAIAPITELEHLVEAVVPDESERDALGLGPAAPVLRIRRRTWVGQQVVTLAYFSHPGDRYRVSLRVRPTN